MPPGRMSTSSGSSENTDKLNLEDDQEWKDAESDEEKIQYVSLFGKETFDSVHAMLKHCKTAHQFDFVKVRDELGVCLYIGPFYYES